jgi:hypothetical protein
MNELGKQLTVSDLEKLTLPAVVFLQKKGIPQIFSWWVTDVSPFGVHFYAGEINMHFFAKRTAEDGITDDTGIPMRIYEFLGEP